MTTTSIDIARLAADVFTYVTDPTHSRVSIDLDFEGHGIGKVLVPLVVRRGAAREMPANCQRLKGRLESMTS